MRPDTSPVADRGIAGQRRVLVWRATYLARTSVAMFGRVIAVNARLGPAASAFRGDSIIVGSLSVEVLRLTIWHRC